MLFLKQAGVASSIGNMIGPALTVGFPAYEAYSGDDSIGGAIGSAAAGYYGYNLGEKLFDKYVFGKGPEWTGLVQRRVDGGLARLGIRELSDSPSWLAKALSHRYVRGVGRLATGMAIASILGDFGKNIGDSVMPIRRGEHRDNYGQQ